MTTGQPPHGPSPAEPERHPCPQTDLVIAHFLDGEAGAPGDGLSRHRQSCPECQRALAMARRLDAVIATSAAVPVDRRTADRLLAGAVAAQESMPPRRRPALRRTWRRAALVAAGFAAALVLPRAGGGDEPQEPPQQTPTVAEHAPGPMAVAPAEPVVAIAPPEPEAAVEIPIPAAVDGYGSFEHVLPPRRTQRDATARSRSESRRDPSFDAGPPALAALQATGLLRRHGLGLRVVDATRRAAEESAASLIAASLGAVDADGASSGTLRWAEHVAGLPDGAVLERVLEHCRHRPELRNRLRRALERRPYPALRTVCAWIGDPRMDVVLADDATDDPDATEQLVAAVQRPARRPDRVRLLLSLWGTVQARGLVAPDAPRAADRAERWFGPLPAPATTTLVDLARASRHAGEQHRCILALGARRQTPASLRYLVQTLLGPRLELAQLAACALGRRPADEIERALLVELRRGRRPELLLAALASSRADGVQRRIHALDATDEERAFLAAGGFDRHQLPIAAALFRRGSQPER